MAFLSRLHELSLGHPYRTILVGWALTMAIGLGAENLHLRTDGAALVPADHPAVREDTAIRTAFGLKDAIVILIPAPPDQSIFNAQTLRRIQEWTDRLLTVPGIDSADLFSLATEKSDRVLPGTLRFQPFLDPFPTTTHDFQKLRDDLRAIAIYHGTLIAQDESATAIMVSVPHGMGRAAFTSQVRMALEDSGPWPEEVSLIGAPIAESLLGTHLLEDLGLPDWLIGRQGGLSLREAQAPIDHPAPDRLFSGLTRFGLVPLAMAVTAMVILISYRSPIACIPPLAKVAACLIFVFGMMGLCGSPVYLPTAIMPVILTVSAISEEVHLFSRFAELLRRHPQSDRMDLLRQMLREVHVPMIKTAITTAVGFLSFAAAPIGPVRSFGVWTSVGVLFGMSYSLLITPAILSLISPRLLFPRRLKPLPSCARQEAVGDPGEESPNDRGDSNPESTTEVRGLFTHLGQFCVRHRHAVLGATMLVIFAAPWGIRRIIVQDSWIDGFAPTSRFAQAAEFFNARFLGMHALHVVVDGPHHSITVELPTTAIKNNLIQLSKDQFNGNIDVVGWQLTLQCAKTPASNAMPDSTLAAPQSWSARIQAADLDTAGDHVRLQLDRMPAAHALTLCPGDDNKLLVTLTPRPWLQPAMLGEIDRLESFISEKKEFAVGGVLGPAKYLKTTNFIIWSRKESARIIPDRFDRIEWLWQQYAATRGEARLRQVVDPLFQRAVITVYLKNANFQDTARLMADLRAYERTHLSAKGIHLSFGGDVAVSQGMIAAVVNTPIRSILISLVGILAVASFVGRSLRIGLLCAMPSSLAVLLIFAFMGWAAIPLGVATSMFAAMTLGIGDDFAIHLVERFRAATDRGLSRAEAAIDAVGSTGMTLTVDALALALGFAVLIVSQVPANARLGLLLVLSLAVCWIASLVILPALMTLQWPKQSPSTPPASEKG